MSEAATQKELRDRLRELGLRATSNRLAVLLVLHQEAAPLSHEALMERLVGCHDIATVYRTLADLTEAGLLRRMDLGDRIWRYELFDACRTIAGQHAHFLCTACGEVTCLPALDVVPRSGSLPDKIQGVTLHVQVSGRCSPCANV
jgi:Fur family ferric uptake transcriptional regulator